MNAVYRNKTFYENSLDKKIKELNNNSDNFSVEEFLIQEFKKKIKFALEYDIAEFNMEVSEEFKKNLDIFENIFNNYNLANLYKNRNKYTKEAFDLILKESENYTYV